MAAPVPYRFSAAIVAVCFVAVCVVYEASAHERTPHWQPSLGSPLVSDYKGTPKLFGFDNKGLAEAIRLAFHVGGIEFEDARIKSSDFSMMKSKLGFGHLPVLQLGNKMHDGNQKILNWVGRKAELTVDESPDADRIFYVVLYVEILFQECFRVLDVTDKHKRYRLGLIFNRDILPYWLNEIEKKMKGNGSKFAAGNKLTIADLSLYTVVNFIEEHYTDLRVSKHFFNPILYPNMSKAHSTVRKHPKVKEWEANHPPAK